MEEELEELEEYYYSLLPPPREYPPIWPELTESLSKAPKMIEECEKLQRVLNKALVKVRRARRLLNS